MSVAKFLKNSGWAAVAAAMVAGALPATAFAQDRGQARQGRGGGEMTTQAPRSDRRDYAFQRQAQQQAQQQQRQAQRIDRRSEQRADRVDQRSERQAQRVERQGDRAAQQAARQGNWNQGQRIDRRSEQAARQIEQRGDQRANRIEQRGDRQAQRAARGNDQMRTYVDPQRNRSYRDNDRDNRWNNDNRWQNDRRADRNDRQWDRRWRDNNRYDWQRYRTTNRTVFRAGTYYAPYRGYTYRRVGIGGVLNSLFFASSYQLNDPWRYRLPDVYGPYRWVRYYDDVLLVDIYSGQVVDVIYDFFW